MKTRASPSATARCLCAGIVITGLLTVALLVEAPARAAVPSIFAPAPFDTTDGRQIYEHICQGCHMPDAGGAVGAGHYPALANDPTLVSRQFMALTVLKGRRNMPAFGAKHAIGFVGPGAALSSAQIAAVVNYVRTHFGNHYKDMITPAEVATLDEAAH
jgi:mono/diheme cytochrome c family protein